MRLVSALLAMALACGGVVLATGSASAADEQTTRLSLAIPLTVPPETTGLIPADILETYTSPTGILTRQLNAVVNQPVALGIDPMIVASIRILGNTAPESAIDWLQRLEDADNETFALSYADSDIAALSQAGSTTVLGPTSFQIDAGLFPVEPDEGQSNGEQTQAPPGTTDPPEQTSPPVEPEVPTSETLTDWPYTIDGLLWPRQNAVTAADLTTFNADAAVTTLLSSGNVAAASGASGAIDGHAVIVSDETISLLVNQAVRAVSVTDWQAAMDELTTALGNWSGSSSILATFDRTIPDTFNRLSETVAALTQLTGIEPTGLATAMAEPQAAIRLVDSPVDSDRISRMRLLLAAEARIIPFASVMADPAPLTGERRLSLLALSSNSWADPTMAWTTSVDVWLERSHAILTSVQIASSSITFVQDKGNLPIAVSNNLDFPVTVYVTVRSATGILVVLDSRVPIELEANSQSRASVPVQSIANGEASLQVSLSSESHVEIGTPKTVTTNVVAGWETTATFVIAALLLVVFIAGIVRTVLKRRRMLAAENAGDPADEALGE